MTWVLVLLSFLLLLLTILPLAAVAQHCHSIRDSVRAAAAVQVKPPFKERPLEEVMCVCVCVCVCVRV